MAPVDAGALITPSRNNFTLRTVSRGSGSSSPWSKRCASALTVASARFGSRPSGGVMRTAKCARAVSFPSRCTVAKASSDGACAIASKNVVTPCLLSASSAALAPLTFSAGVGAGICLATVSCAASSSIPVGLPDESLATLPPRGSGVRAVMPASCKARELTSAV